MILREMQNQNDAGDANDAESGDMVKGYPKNSVISVICVTIVTQEQRGGLGNTPEMCMWMTTCYASKTRPPQNDDKQTRYPHKFVYALKSESV